MIPRTVPSNFGSVLPPLRSVLFACFWQCRIGRNVRRGAIPKSRVAGPEVERSRSYEIVSLNFELRVVVFLENDKPGSVSVVDDEVIL